MAEAWSAITALGVHQSTSVTAGIPLWLLELRKIVLAQIYTIDKMFATFVGRPFSISSKICFLQIPLDLDDDQLALPSDELETLVHKLKNDSSSPMESMNRRFGYTKLSVSILVMREEILQLFLGPPRADVQHVIM